MDGLTSFQLAIGFLAGNVFDWGAKEVALLMEEGKLVSQISVHKKHYSPPRLKSWMMIVGFF